MKMCFIFFTCLLMTSQIVAQANEPLQQHTEQQLEQLTAQQNEIESEDDAFEQELQQFLKHPLNLNEADDAQLKTLLILDPIQVRNLVLYRQLAGKLIDLYELQAVPGWDIATIQKLRPYISVSNENFFSSSLKELLEKGEHSILLRASQVLERSKGYRPDSAATNFYQGSPQKLFFRYKYAYKNLLQFGIIGEKDAGEQFLKGKQKLGFDFYSFHVFLRTKGIIKQLAIGDFTVNLAQGLIQWQSLAFRKSTDAMLIKRESAVLRPYNSAGEFNFHRGIGLTLAKRNWSLTVFGSFRNIDANFVDDTLHAQDHVSALQASGYHRTRSEAEDKGMQQQLTFGGNLSYRYKALQVGVNAVQYRFKYPLIKSPLPYNRDAISGNRHGNFSIDYSYTFRNLHFFGEAAFTPGAGKAFINGLMLSVSSKVDLSVLYRDISASYRSLNSSAFTESADPANERGSYVGISVKPGSAWRIDGYADVFRFPWLRYRVDAPSAGTDLLLQLSYRHGRRFEISSRYRVQTKAINSNPDLLTLSPVVRQPRNNWRTQLNMSLSRDFELRNRAEMVWYDKNGRSAEAGFLFYVDLLYKPALEPWSGSARMQYFETDGYNSRVYAYENDVQFSNSVPVFYEKGYRYYININYEAGRKFKCWARWSQTIYPAKTLIGSGLDEIHGNTRSEVKLQLMYKF